MAPLPPSDVRDPELADAVRDALATGFEQPVHGLTTQTASPSIAELVDVIGEEATRTLCERLGGISRMIGKPSVEFITAIGEEKAKVLRAYWGGGHIYIPRHAMSPEARHERIRDLVRAGQTRQQVAIAMGISERQVYKVLARKPALPAAIPA